MTPDSFRRMIAKKGREHWRDMPWRDDTRPYYVLVSELMLQQTQVSRVIPKFEAFVKQFPDEQALARASLADVLKMWQGLGYNRRAKYLHDAARMMVQDSEGMMPTTQDELLRLPGVGKNTAGAIMAYAYDEPVVFVETNIRTVYIHHFFGDDEQVSDAAIIERLSATLDRDNPRGFYQALMDYGSWLKANGVRNTARSAHYVKQPSLHGSVRQIRGQIIAALTAGEMARMQLESSIMHDQRFEPALAGLVQDGLVEIRDDRVRLTK